MLVSFNGFSVKLLNNSAINQNSSTSGFQSLKRDTVSFRGNKVWQEFLATGAQKGFLKEAQSSMYGDTDALFDYIKQEKVQKSSANIKAILIAVENTRRDYLYPYYREILDYWKVSSDELKELKVKEETVKKLGY